MGELGNSVGDEMHRQMLLERFGLDWQAKVLTVNGETGCRLAKRQELEAFPEEANEFPTQMARLS